MISSSVFTGPMDDPAAVVLDRGRFPVHADGIGDDSPALQAAINHVQETTRVGIVFVPEGRYRLAGTVRVWSGIRMIGFGSRRPVLTLGPRTSGFDGGRAYMLHFAGHRPAPGQPIRDGNAGTFYSALSNIDFEVGDGNPEAVCVRFHVAQHSFITHARFDIGSGYAGAEDVGNEMEDVEFVGGRFGIVTRRTAPSWPFVLLDSLFTGQRDAAIRTGEAGLTVIRAHFRGIPTVVRVHEGRTEQLYMKDCRFDDVDGPAIILDNDRNARTGAVLDNIACENVQALAFLPQAGRTFDAPSPRGIVHLFRHGLCPGEAAGPATVVDADVVDNLPPLVPTDIAALPAQDSWANVRGLGAVGDGVVDDTVALTAAIAAHRVLYFPTGRYRISSTLRLRPDTVAIGLHPATTVIAVDDRTPAFSGPGGPVALIEAPEFRNSLSACGEGRGGVESGANILNGIGVDTGGANERAVGVKWMAGDRSLISDVRFHGGHGTLGPDGAALACYNANHTGDPEKGRRWDSQYPSLWVTRGGGGVFKDIWTPNPFSQSGLYVSDTDTPGRVYAMSVEHHVRTEVRLRNVRNWDFYGLQTEEEWGEGSDTVAIRIADSSNLTFANLFLYRVLGMTAPAPHAVTVTRCRNLRFINVHSFSHSKFSLDNTLSEAPSSLREVRDPADRASQVYANVSAESCPQDILPSSPRIHSWVANVVEGDRALREREFAWLHYEGRLPDVRLDRAAALLDPSGSGVRRLAGGFRGIDAAAVDTAGNLYFLDGPASRMHRWLAETAEIEMVLDAPLHLCGLAYAADGTLMATASTGHVYAIDLTGPEPEIAVLEPRRGGPPSGSLPILPLNRWRNMHDWDAAVSRPQALSYVSPDLSVFLPAGERFRDWSLPDPPGSLPRWMVGAEDIVRAYGLSVARPDTPFYVTDEFGQRTWAAAVNVDGTLLNLTLFAEEGEAGAAVDSAGHVYVAAGHIRIYGAGGDVIGAIKVPERPTALAFGAADRRTLFILARTSLYAIRTRYPGRL
ncbi:MAG: glycosyl hydrolase family 28-related protein [Capsulimonadaceae bacterium]